MTGVVVPEIGGDVIPATTREAASDLERLKKVMRTAPLRRKRRGRPGRQSRTEEPAAPEPAPREQLPSEESQFWGRQLQSLFATVASVRGPHWAMPDAVAEAAGEPMALVARKWLPAATDRPELVLAIVLVPWILSAVKVEIEQYQARQAAQAAARRERGTIRPQGEREDDAGPEFVGTPFTMPDR